MLNQVVQTWRMAEMVALENLPVRKLPRRPEPELMCDTEGVAAFHQEGSSDGCLLPVYHFNALALSRMLPKGGRLLDLGTGSGRFMAYLARRRPDVSIVGVELSAAMAETGRNMCVAAGVHGQVRIEAGDMTELARYAGGGFDAISCIYALHHLPTAAAARKCLSEVARLRHDTGCGVWIFDHCRPRNERTARLFPKVFSPKAAPDFQRDSGNSLLASFSFAELCAWTDEILGPAGHAIASFLPLLQAHWLPPGRKSGASEGAGHALWNDEPLAKPAARAFRQLARAMQRVRL